MSIDNFIPSVWSGSLLRALRTTLVFPQLTNRDYEGDIANVGDSVRINMIGDVTINSGYTKNADIPAPETLTDAQLVLKIDQADTFNFAVDDVDQVQQRPSVMEEAMSRAAYGLRKVTDSFVAGLYTDAATQNLIGSDGSPLTSWKETGGSGQYLWDTLVDLGTKLDEADVPEDNRFVVIPPWGEALLLKDSRFTGYGTANSRAVLTSGQLEAGAPAGAPTGYIGRAAGMSVYVSNQVPVTSGTHYKLIAGHPMAWSFVDQILKIEAYRPQLRFSDAIKGLHVYGGKVVRPYALAVATANRT